VRRLVCDVQSCLGVSGSDNERTEHAVPVGQASEHGSRRPELVVSANLKFLGGVGRRFGDRPGVRDGTLEPQQLGACAVCQQPPVQREFGDGWYIRFDEERRDRAYGRMAELSARCEPDSLAQLLVRIGAKQDIAVLQPIAAKGKALGQGLLGVAVATHRGGHRFRARESNGSRDSGVSGSLADGGRFSLKRAHRHWLFLLAVDPPIRQNKMGA
jgi:hypothetical protein